MMSLKQCDAPQSLYNVTREKLLADPRTFEQLTIESGIPFYWLQKFAAGCFLSPNVNRVQYLYEFLTKTKLLEV